MIDVRFAKGVYLPAEDFWLDPHGPRRLAFVSHAHSDHIGDHEEIIMSRATARLMRERLPGRRVEHRLEFGEKVELHGMGVTLLPAGHIFGSAQILVETGAGSLLYTGDFKLRPGLSAEPTEWRHAETLIMETTYGLPKYRLPPTEVVMAQMVDFCEEALREDCVPVLLGYSLGKAQEILCALLKAGLKPMLHRSVWRLTEIYRALQPEFPTGYVPYAEGNVAGHVLICPPHTARSLMLRRLKNRRVAMLTGWALDSGATYRYQCDAAFPLSDHADYDDLVRYVELVQPKRVLTLHGFATEFARDLRERGYEAWALTGENQLEFALREGDLAAMAARSVRVPEVVDPAVQDAALGAGSPFYAFASLGERIGATSSKLEKVRLLAEVLQDVKGEELAAAAVYLTGRAFPQGDPRVLQTGWSIIWRAMLFASKIGETALRAIGRAHADAGKTAYEALLGRTEPRAMSWAEVREFFDRLAELRGPAQKTEWMQKRLATVTALEASYLVRILTGDLRIGLREGLVEEAIAAAFEVPVEAVREANMLTGDIGEVAQLASAKSLETASLRVMRPIKCMLASPEPTAMAIWGRIMESAGQGTGHAYWVEDKFDGIRAQLHVNAGEVEIYTRDLRRATGMFPELARSARGFSRSVILDGEILAFAEGKKLTFFDLQKRLGRKAQDDLFLGTSDVPVVYRAFDLLWIDGESLLRTPLVQRREKLEALDLPEGFEIAARIMVYGAEDIERAFREARLRGNEGLILKDGASLYTPGRRGMSWLKLKKELATLDVVVVGAEQGHGKRSGVLSDYTFAVRDDDSGALLTIGKAYSGLTDEEIEELTQFFLETTIEQHGRYREVEPRIVLEVAFDSVQLSKRHTSGLALRFPRIKAIRRDKTPAEIDTLAFARSLVGNETLNAGG